jgi:arginyl-tRNA synthetase
MVKLPSGKMKSREGTVVDADDLIEEMVERAKEVIREKHQDLPESEVVERAEMIGLGAMKFFLLFVPPANGMSYDPAASISFEGKTGPYCQYAAVRARNIIEKAAGMNLQPNLSGALAGVTQLGLPERALAVQLMKLPVQIRASALELNPSILASHIHAIAQAFNSFYNSTPVLKDEPVSAAEIGLVQIRLGLVQLTQQAIENGLGLLGIQTPKKM